MLLRGSHDERRRDGGGIKILALVLIVAGLLGVMYGKVQLHQGDPRRQTGPRSICL